MNRFICVREKIPKEKTGLKADLYIHIDHEPGGRIDSIRFSEKGRDGSTLDRILTALGDAATDIIRGLRKPGDTAA